MRRRSDASAMLSSVEKSITSPCWRRSSGTKPIPALIAAVGDARRSGFSATPDRARVVAIDPENRAGDLAASGPDQSSQGDHLARPDLERDVDEDTLAGETVHLENRAGGVDAPRAPARAAPCPPFPE